MAEISLGAPYATNFLRKLSAKDLVQAMRLVDAVGTGND